MFANPFQYAKASTAVTALLGASVTRFWPFSEAPQKGEQDYGLPYAVYQNVYGTPELYVNQISDIDNLGVQVDSYGRTVSECRNVAVALRNAFEPYGYVVSYNGEEKDADTGLYRVGFTVEFWQAH